MTEPPAKRARRTDSSTMWDMNESNPRGADRGTKEVDAASKRDGAPRGDTRRSGDNRDAKDDGRRRSRSRERPDRRRERSRSKDRRGRGGREPRPDRERDGRSGRGREGSASRDRKPSRQDYAPRGSKYRERSHSRSRSRTRSPNRGGNKARARSPPPTSRADRKEVGRSQRMRNGEKGANGNLESKPNRDVEAMDIDDGDEAALDRQMRSIMGFSAFRSTQNTKVPGNNVYGVRKEKKTEYRQYMNRVGGFNRPLSPNR